MHRDRLGRRHAEAGQDLGDGAAERAEHREPRHALTEDPQAGQQVSGDQDDDEQPEEEPVAFHEALARVAAGRHARPLVAEPPRPAHATAHRHVDQGEEEREPHRVNHEGEDDEERAVEEAVLVPDDQPRGFPDDVGVDREDDRRQEGDQ